MSNKRTKKSLYNVISNFSIFFVKTLLVFGVRSILISKVSQTYIGINGLFTNILSVLSLAELGIGSAIGFSLYKPLSENDTKKISILMAFYKKAYMIIGTIILIIGLLLIPVLPYLVEESVPNMILIYCMFLLNTFVQYFISYKEVLIASDQNNYKLTKINLLFTILINIGEMAVLFLTSSFILYLSVQFIFTIIQRCIINRYITKTYSNINFKTSDKMDNDTRKDIFKNIKAMVYHKLGDCMINSTDNIIISYFIGINTVGIYSNYLLIISYLTTFSNMIYGGILASLGNFMVTETQERKYEIFKKTNFLGTVIFSYFAVLLLNIFNPVIMIIANGTYVLSFFIVMLIIVNYYMTGLRTPSSNMKIAAGMFDIDKYTPIIQSIINIVVSIVLAKPLGLAGVLIGTFASSLLPTIQRPYIVYKYILNKPVKLYWKDTIINIFITIMIAGITLLLNSYIDITFKWFELAVIILITTITYALVLWMFSRKKAEYKYYVDFVKGLVNSKSKH